MYLDRATLEDLEIVPTPAARGTTVWSLVDRTRTRAGREALRRRLLSPPHAADEILALQRAHQLLAADADGFRSALDRSDPDGAEAYLNANWQLPDDMPPASRMRQWYRDYVQDVALGQARVAALLKVSFELSDRLASANASPLAVLAIEMAAILEKPLVSELRVLTTGRSGTVTRAFDQLARGGAKPLLLDLLQCLGDLEALWSVGVTTLEHGWAYPRPSSRLEVIGLVHPFLGADAVRNDLRLSEETRVCFVTGPNMAGKSTMMKALAVAVVLAHIGSGVPARSMTWPIVATVFSSVHVKDNLDSGESFYLAEVRRMKSLAAVLLEQGSALAVIDEPFRGTNVHDAAEATVAIITRLASHPEALALVASHVAEVVPAILDDPRVALFHFAADVSAACPRFDYRIREGVSAQRLGMTLLRQEGVLELLEQSVGQSTSI